MTDDIIQQQAFTGLQSELTGPIKCCLAFTELLCVPGYEHTFVAKTASDHTHTHTQQA